MIKLYELNDKFAKIPKLGKLQILIYPLICFGLLAFAIVLITVVNYLNLIIS